ncbi:MAG TPA: NUDIX domain-containing protein [Rugosimonospora sp.]|nr:NUDIX domain-containing protein [Rugosimonospora sp.]
MATGSIGEALAGYRPGDEAEAADLLRLGDLCRSGRDVWGRATPLHVTGSAVIVHPPSRRVLLRWHARQGAWLQVGGHADPGEVDPLAVALREGREETGLVDLEPWPDASIAHVVIVPVKPRGDEPAHEHADVRYVLATGQPEAARPEHPEAPLRWLAVPEALAEVTRPNLRETLLRVDRLLTS